jgi:hypothetical protein
VAATPAAGRQRWLCTLDLWKKKGIDSGGLGWATRLNEPKPAGKNRKENRMVWFVGWAELMERIGNQFLNF